MFKRDARRVLASQRGMSLVEILVALTLLGLGGTFIAGKIFQQLHEGKVKAAKIQMGQLSERLQEFRRHCGFYPSADQGLDALVTKPTSPHLPFWCGQKHSGNARSV